MPRACSLSIIKSLFLLSRIWPARRAGGHLRAVTKQLHFYTQRVWVQFIEEAGSGIETPQSYIWSASAIRNGSSSLNRYCFGQHYVGITDFIFLNCSSDVSTEFLASIRVSLKSLYWRPDLSTATPAFATEQNLARACHGWWCLDHWEYTPRFRTPSKNSRLRGFGSDIDPWRACLEPLKIEHCSGMLR